MKVKEIFNKIYPYIIILILSLFATYLVFYKGITRGDDYNFHFANIIDLYETLKSSYKVTGIEGYIASGIGVATRLFYSPVAPFSVALLAKFNDFFNFDLIISYKEIIVLSVFVSGIFMYKLAIHVTNNKVASLLAAATYILFPYRLFDLFCRFAIAEAISFVFIPLFFMGLYDITHQKDKLDLLSFIEVILGGSLLYLSHNLTAFYCYIVGFIYLLVNIKGIINGYKTSKKYILYCFVSAFLLFSIASSYLFSQLELISSNLYNITDRVKMWTDVDAVVNRSGEELSYSGILNISFLTNKFSSSFTGSSLLAGLALYIFGCCLYIAIDISLKQLKKYRKIYSLIPIILFIILISLTARRFEIYLATFIFIILYKYNYYSINNDNKNDKNELLKDINFWFCFIMSIISLVMMEEENIWKKLPAIFLNIQFPWRLWTFVQFYFSLLVAIIIHKVNAKKTISIIVCIMIGFLMAINEPLVEKRMRIKYYYDDYVIAETDYGVLKNGSILGWNREYCPQVFYDDDYEVIYSNSLYFKIRKRIKNGFSNIESYSIKPVVLQGKANITVNDSYAPYYDMDIVVNEDTIIQMPLIYYAGYEFSITNIDTNESYKIEPYNIDGLLAFDIEKGSYHVTSTYKGTKFIKLGKVLSYSGSIITFSILVYAIYDKKKKKLIIKKEA